VHARVAGRDLLGPDDIARVEEVIYAEQAAGDVRDALDRAPAAEQDVVRLVATGRTPGQAADELGISRGAAWTRLSRARRRLRAQFPTIDEERSR
jgi:RNA polymerase sigma-70 factor (ECF subfamily)